jgi:hypothetical protein
MMRWRILCLCLALSAPLCAESISPAIHEQVMLIADREGVPRSVANWLQVEESGDRHTGAWGDPLAVSHESVRGYHSKGLFQLFEEPSNINYLLEMYYKDDLKNFDIFCPLCNATVAMRYLSALHRRYGTWYAALVHYNHGSIRGESQDTRDYATRIINARNP